MDCLHRLASAFFDFIFDLGRLMGSSWPASLAIPPFCSAAGCLLVRWAGALGQTAAVFCISNICCG